MKIYVRIFSFLYCFLLMQQVLQARYFFRALAEQNLKSLSLAVDEEEIDFDSMPFHEAMQVALQQQLALKPLVKRAKCFSLFKKFEKKHPFLIDYCLDGISCSDLEMVLGSKTHPANYFATSLDRTITEVGKVMFLAKCITPTADMQRLQQQQALIRYLINHQELFNQLNDQMIALQQSEDACLSFWDKDMFSTMVRRNLLIKFFLNKRFETWINLQPWAVELRDKLQLATRIVAIPLLAKLSFDMVSSLKNMYWYGIENAGDKDFIEKHLPSLLDPWVWFKLPTLMYVITKAVGERFEKPFICATADSAEAIRSIGSYSEEKEYYQHVFTMRKCLHTKLIEVARFLNNAQTLIKTVQSNDILYNNLPFLKTLDFNCKNKSKNVEKLLSLLQTQTFTGEPSSIKQYTGRVVVAYRLMSLIKEELADLFVAVGELDAQLSIVRLYQEFEKKRVSFCLPTFINSQSGPAVQAINFFNPMIDAQRVIPNSLTLGAAFDAKRNIVVTGPNAGGKSTIMKGFLLSVICAQSLGIAPARELTLTPFSRIMTYLNITDDLAAGNSHFKAGVIRARQLLDAAEVLKLNEYGLFAADEIFNGTTYEEGQAAAFSLLYKLGSLRNVMVISPTHFPLVASLEQQAESFSNYKVSVSYDSYGKLIYPYKLELGRAHQNVAFKILEEEGFGSEFLEMATCCLEH